MKAAETCVAVAQGGDKLAYSKSNLDFHGIIYRASRNHFLENTIQRVSARAAIYRRQALTLPDWAMRSAAEHLEIARAITSHDHVRAESLMAHHINIFGRPDFPRFVVLLSEQLETATFPPPIATRA